MPEWRDGVIESLKDSEYARVFLDQTAALQVTVAELERENLALRKCMSTLCSDDWAHGCKALKGNEKLPGDIGRFYAGYNSGIDAQFSKTVKLIRSVLEVAR